MIALTKPFTFGSLFAGIGGLDLGLEWAGMTCKWQVEIDKFATKILAKHWPNVARHGDIRDCGAHNLKPVDLICGGFPCQDISNAGKRAGIEGERSGLWKEFYRIICELQPSYILVENVSALLHRGIERVLGDLASCGYDAEWSVLSACSMGAPHMRERVFIVAYPYRKDGYRRVHDRTGAKNTRWTEISTKWSGNRQQPQMGTSIDTRLRANWWGVEPTVDRMAPRVPHRVDRLRGLGNAVVPQVAEHIGRCILASVQWEVQS